jgi:CheY-like chemotaxis protein/HD-like signal output (HDOD) protein
MKNTEKNKAVATKILVVEDEQYIRKFINRVLSDRSYEVQLAASAKQAYEIISTWDFDVLLTDIYLGNATGIDVIHKVREHKGEGLPVFVMTGFATEQFIDEAKVLGVEKFIFKPIVVEKLLDTIASASDKDDKPLRQDEKTSRSNSELPSPNSIQPASSPGSDKTSLRLPHDPKKGSAPRIESSPFSLFDVVKEKSGPLQTDTFDVQDSGVISTYRSNTTLLSALRYKSVFEDISSTFAAGNFDRVRAWLSEHPGYQETLHRLANSQLFTEGAYFPSFDSLLQTRGIEWARRIVSALTLCNHAKEMCGAQFLDQKQLMRHCFTSASVAYLLASKGEGIDPEHAIFGALLHDVGKIILASLYSRTYRHTQLATGTSILTAETEAECMGITHTGIMEALIGLWNLPEFLHSPLCKHHMDWTELINESNSENRLGLCIKVADTIAKCMERLTPPYEWLHNIPAGVLGTLGIDSDKLESGFRYLPAILKSLHQILPMKSGDLLNTTSCTPVDLNVLYIARRKTSLPPFIASLNRSMIRVVMRHQLSEGKSLDGFTHVILNPSSRSEAAEMLQELSKAKGKPSIATCLYGTSDEIRNWLMSSPYRKNVTHFPSSLSNDEALSFFGTLNRPRRMDQSA